MAYVYVGTAQQVDAVRTASLLVAHPLHAIWCPPPNLRPWNVIVAPVGNEACLLVWREGNDGPVIPIGFGNFLPAAAQNYGTGVLWTNANLGGLNPFAQGIGYEGGTGACYLRLRAVSLIPQAACANLAQALPALQNGLNQIGDPPPWNPGIPIPCQC